MESQYGWTGSILHINLSSRTFERQVSEEALRLHFLGGRGINSKLLYQEVGPETEPLAPENVIIFGSSPFSGTIAPCTPRCTITAKSPLTGILGDANFGGFFTPMMKKAGDDHIVIRGVSENPVYLFITEHGVAFKDASHLWGRFPLETEERIQEELGDKKVKVVSIGPAGENLVRIACIVHNYNVAGRTGMGAVMGSKNLKAIAVKGTGKIPVAHPELIKKQTKKWRKKIKENPNSQYLGKYGSAGPLALEDKLGVLSVRNFEKTSGFEGVEKVTDAALEKYFTKSNSCFSCPVHCIQSFEVKDEGPYQGIKGTKMPEGCTSPCGPGCGNTNAASLFKIYKLTNEYGIDVLDYGTIMSIAMDWYEHGIINNEDTDGIPLNWGNHASLVKMVSRVSMREGFGDLLADGAIRAARKIGKKAEDYVNACKGMIIGGVDPRTAKGSALCFATATRGGDHLRGGVMIEMMGNIMGGLTADEAEKRFGSKDVLVSTSYNKAAAANFFQDVYTMADALEVCKFITAHNGHGITLEDMSDMLYAVTGVRMDDSGMREVANRIFTVERAFLVREGITKQDDFLRGKWVKGPVPNGPFEGNTIEEDKWQQMLEEYYETRGWDPETGIPTRETLERLGLQEIARELEALGKLT